MALKTAPALSTEPIILPLALGYTLLTLISAVLLSFGILASPFVTACFWCSGIVLAAISLPQSGRWLRGCLLKSPIYTSFLGMIFLIGFSLCLVPEIDRDSLVYHTALPKQWLAQAEITAQFGNIYSYFPLNIELGYALGLQCLGPQAPKLIGFSFFLLLCLVLNVLADHPRRLGSASSRTSRLAMPVFALVPSAFCLGISSYVDLALACYLLLAVFCLAMTERQAVAWSIVGGIFAGFAMGIKYHGLVLFPIFALCYVWDAWRGKQRKHYIVLFATTVIVACPWYIRNILVTGNPLYPFLYEIFGGLADWDLTRMRWYDIHLSTYGLDNLTAHKDLLYFLSLPFRMSFFASFDGKAYDGIIGPVVLLGALCLCWRRVRSTIPAPLAIFSVFYALSWAFSSNQLRFFMPLLALACGGLNVTLSALQKRKWLRSLFLVLIVATAASNAYSLGSHLYKRKYLDFFSEDLDSKLFLRKHLSHYAFYEEINAIAPPASKIYLIGLRGYGYYLDHSYTFDAVYDGYRFEQWLKQSMTGDVLSSKLKAEGITHLAFDWRFFLNSSRYESGTAEHAESSILKQRCDNWLRANATAVSLKAQTPFALYALR